MDLGIKQSLVIFIDNEKITKVGKVDKDGIKEIDAEENLVTPGWVDIHTHYDGQVCWDHCFQIQAGMVLQRLLWEI